MMGLFRRLLYLVVHVSEPSARQVAARAEVASLLAFVRFAEGPQHLAEAAFASLTHLFLALFLVGAGSGA